MKIIQAITIFCCALVSLSVNAQEINYSPNDPGYQFSGLAKWKDKILLIPQHRSVDDSYNIIAIDTLSIDSVLAKTKLDRILASDTLYLTKDFQDTVKSIIKDELRNDSRNYGGFEAAIVMNDIMIFLTVETDSPFFYVIKGAIFSDSIKYNRKIKVPKPDTKYKNAGFESISYLKGLNKLITFYENNRNTADRSAYLLDTSFVDKPEPLKFKNSLLFRLTDAAQVDSTTLLCLNHYFNDCKFGNEKNCEECDYYIGKNNLKKAKKEMGKFGPEDSCFTRLVKVRYINNKLIWDERATTFISYSLDNWEGIIPYKQGVLMIVDAVPGDTHCKLQYFKLN
jgi:hypothetical protein